MRILLIVIKTTEKRKPKIYEGKQMRERLVNKLTFYIDKLHLQEVCCRSCFYPRVYTTCFLQSTFNSLVSIPDTRVLGEALLSSPTPIKKKNKKTKTTLFCSPFINLLLKLCFTWNYCAYPSRMKC